MAAATSRTRETPPTLRLRFAYDRYLSSVEAVWAQRSIARRIASNVGPQWNVFAERMVTLKRELGSLSESLATKNRMMAERDELVGKIDALEMINTNVTFDDEDARVATLFADTASKVVVKNYRVMNAGDLNAANKLLNEIIESIKSFDCQNKINARNQLKDLLIQVTMLTIKLNKLKSKCKEVFKEEQSLQNHNLSLKILRTQFNENPNASLLPKECGLVEQFSKILDELEL